MKKYLPYLAVVYVAALLLAFPESSIMYAKDAQRMCAEILVPSLFPFFVCSGLLIYSGLAKRLSALCRPIMKPLFNINGSGAAAFVLGIISGYPLGAVTAAQLYSAGYLSKSEAERLLAFCNNSGPLFIMGAVGTAIYGSRKIGIALYAAHILAAVTVGVIFRFYKKNSHSAPEYRVNQPERSFGEVFSEVLSNSINSILTVCGAVIFFGVAANAAVKPLPEDSMLKTLILGIAELTGGIKSISTANISLTEKLVMSAFAAGFAGLCVHIQVMANVAKCGISLKPYIFGKLLHGVLAALYTYVYFKIFPPAGAVFAQSSATLGAGFYVSSLYTVCGAFAAGFMPLAASGVRAIIEKCKKITADN